MSYWAPMCARLFLAAPLLKEYERDKTTGVDCFIGHSENDTRFGILTIFRAVSGSIRSPKTSRRSPDL